MNSLTRALKKTALIGALLTALPAAFADPVLWNFSYATADHSVSASGVLTTVDQGNGSFLVTGISGTRNGATITGLEAQWAYLGDDNMLTAAAPQLTFAGISYDVGADKFNVFFHPDMNIYREGTGSIRTDLASFTATMTSAVPEPASWAMMGLGALGLAVVRRRRAA